MDGAEEREWPAGRRAAARRGARPPPTTGRPAPSARSGSRRGQVVVLREVLGRGGRAPSGRRRTAVPASWWVTAFQPSFQMPRWPSISKYCGPRASWRAGSAKAGARLTPCTGICGTPATTSGGAMPSASRMVGAMSMAWQNWSRVSPAAFSPRRPVHDQRVAHAAAVGVLLVPLQRRVAGLGPAPGDVAVAVRAADVVQPLDRLVDVLADAVEPLHLVEHAGGAALLAGAVVGESDEEGVVPPVRSTSGSRPAGRSARRCGRAWPRRPPAAGRRTSARCR